jgi:hypothetical protein
LFFSVSTVCNLETTMSQLRRVLGLDKPKSSGAQTPAASPPPRKKGRKPPLPEVVSNGVVTQQCGHRVAVLFLQRSACPGCIAKRRKAKFRGRQVSRLPDGSRFAVAYDATLEAWHGTLTVAGMTFEAAASSVFGLLVALDGLYRQALERTETVVSG